MESATLQENPNPSNGKVAHVKSTRRVRQQVFALVGSSFLERIGLDEVLPKQVHEGRDTQDWKNGEEGSQTIKRHSHPELLDLPKSSITLDLPHCLEMRGLGFRGIPFYEIGRKKPEP